jgi:hypothetical protein
LSFFVELGDPGARADLQPTLLELLLRKGRDFRIFHRQDAIEHFYHRHVGAHGAVE